MTTAPTVRPRAARRADERGSTAVEALLLLPAMMLLAVFVLWAGRSGQAALAADLAAEEAATVAALHCEEGMNEECGALVREVLSTNSQLDFLCVGGPRAVGDDPLVQQAWLRGRKGGGPIEAEDVGVLGVRFGCETDGAVAPLRGLLPNVTFYGQSTEVAVRPSLPTLRISDALSVVEGEPLVFRIELTDYVGQEVTLAYTISAETPYTSAPHDYLEGPLTVTIPNSLEAAFITVYTEYDDLHEADEQITVRLGAVPVDAVSGNPLLSYSDAQGLGTILDDDDLIVTVSDSAPAQEEVDEFVVFQVEVANAGRDVALFFRTEDIPPDTPLPPDLEDLFVSIRRAVGDVACVDPPTPDYQALTKTLEFTPDVVDFGPVAGTVEVPLCPDEEAEPTELFNLEWSYGSDPTGTAVGIIEADKMRIFVMEACDAALLSVTVDDAHACGDESSEEVVFTVVLAPSFLGFGESVTLDYVARPADSLETVEFRAIGYGSDTNNPCDTAAPLPLEVDGDFESVWGTLTFDGMPDDPNAADLIETKEVSVLVRDDTLDEHDEVFWLTLCNMSDNVRTTSAQGLGVIADDDGEPSLTVLDAVAEEGSDKADGDVWLEFQVELDAVSAKEVTVEYHTADLDDPGYLEYLELTRRGPASENVDYVQVPERTSVTIPAGDVSATLRVDIVEDRLLEGRDELFAVRLQAFNASVGSIDTDSADFCREDVAGDDCAVGTIIEDDLLDIDGDGIGDRPLHLEIDDAGGYEGQDLTFLIRLVDDRGDPASIIKDLAVTVETQNLPGDYDYTYGVPSQDSEFWKLLFMASSAYGNIEPGELLDNDYVPRYRSATAPASPDSDYLPLVNRVVIKAGESEVPVTVTTMSDAADEHFERFALRLTTVSEAVGLKASVSCVGPDIINEFNYTLILEGDKGGGSDDCAVGTIADGSPIPRVSVGWRTAVEGRDAVFTIRLVDQYSGARVTSEKGIIAVNVSTTPVHEFGAPATAGNTCGGSTDYIEPTSEPLNFQIGESEKTVSVEMCEDDKKEDVEYFTFWGSVDEEFIVKPFSDFIDERDLASSILVKLYDADQTRVTIVHTGSDTGPSVLEGQRAIFEVEVFPRASPGETTQAVLDLYPTVTVDWGIHAKSYDPSDLRRSADEHDYRDDDPTHKLTFGPSESVKTIAVETVDDQVSEPIEGFEVVLENPSIGLLIADIRAHAEIIDNDCWDPWDNSSPPGVTLAPSDGPEAGFHVFAVELEQRICRSIRYRVRAQTLGTTSAADLSVEWQTYTTPYHVPGWEHREDLTQYLHDLVVHQFAVAIIEDEIDEEHEPYQIVFEWDEEPYRGKLPTISTTVHIFDDDTSLVTVDDATGIEGDSLRFYVRLSVPNSRAVTVSYETQEMHVGTSPAQGGTDCAPGDDFIHKDGTVTIEAGSVSVPIDVRLCGDTLTDGGEQFFLVIKPVPGIALPASIVDNQGSGTIFDLSCVDPGNPHDPVPVISATNASVTIREDDRSASMSVTLDPPFCEDQNQALEFNFIADTADVDDLATAPPLISPVASRTAVTTVPVLHKTDDGIEEEETYTWSVNWDPVMVSRNPEYGSTPDVEIPDVEIEVTLIDEDDESVPVVTLVRDAGTSTALEGDAVSFDVHLNHLGPVTPDRVTVYYQTEPDATRARRPRRRGPIMRKSSAAR